MVEWRVHGKQQREPDAGSIPAVPIYVKREYQTKKAIGRMRTLGIVILLILTVGVCGCTHNKKVSTNDIDTYLKDKYNNDFTYLSNGNDPWNATTNTYKYSDSKNVFQVQVTAEHIADNYNSVLFDSEIQKYINSSIRTRCKIYVYTEGEFLGKSGKFDNYNEYVENCSVISLAVYSTDKEVKNQLSDELSELLPDTTLNVVFKVISSDSFRIK